MATIHHKKYLRRAIAAIAIALYAGVFLRAVAQDPKGLNIDVANCVALEKPEDRLACFEAQVAAARQRAAPAGASDATGSATAVTGASAAAVAGASAAASKGASTDAGRIPSSADAAEPVSPGTAPALHGQKSASEPRPAENGGRTERSSEREPVEIVAKVIELRQTVPNAYVITLDNGQVYRQAHPMPYPLRTGLIVHVRDTTFGYRLTAPELHGQINVERVR
jgi:hypothetical protein